MEIDKHVAYKMAIRYKIENPDTYHSVDFVAKKIFQRQTYEWFQKDNNKNNKENNNNEIT